jgi:hypothetical protein
MFLVRKRGYQFFASSKGAAERARAKYPELKGGRIKNILQLGTIKLEVLYLHGEEVQP